MSASLTVQYHRSLERKSLYAYGLRVVVTNAVDMSDAVFIFQRGATPAPATGEQPRDTFVAIADPVDLEELPVSVPDLQNEIPYYRLPEVTLVFRSLEELNETEDLIKADLDLLVRSVNALTGFTMTEEVTYDGSTA